MKKKIPQQKAISTLLIFSSSSLVLFTHAGFSAPLVLDDLGNVINTSTSLGQITVGVNNQASLTIENGAVVDTNLVGTSAVRIGGSQSGSLTVTGNGSSLNTNSLITSNTTGIGTLIIENGGNVTIANSSATKPLTIGDSATSSGVVIVRGPGSSLINNSASTIGIAPGINVGHLGYGELSVTDGGTVKIASVLRIGGGQGNTSLSRNSNGSVYLSGPGSTIEAATVSVGTFGNGSLMVLDGAKLIATHPTFSNNIAHLNPEGKSVALVSGQGSLWSMGGLLNIGLGTSATAVDGSLYVANNGTVSSATGMVIASGINSTGLLSIGDGETSTAGFIETPTVTFGSGTGTLSFNHTSSNYRFSPVIRGAGHVDIHQGSTTLTGLNTYSGITHIIAGNLLAGAENTFSPNSDYIVDAPGTLRLNSFNQTIASLANSGGVYFGGNSQLTITGDYIGNNGTLYMSTVLGDDTSNTDKLVVEGDTSGSSRVKINNAGGMGAQTVNGIEVIQVQGVSNGEFIQSGRIVAGAYEYQLKRGPGKNYKNWYLLNYHTGPGPGPDPDPDPSPDPSPDPGPDQPVERPEVGAYSANLAASNNMFVTRLHDRLGRTRYTDVLTGEQKVTSLWLRTEGGHNRFRDEHDQLSTQADSYVVQLGGDIAQWSNNGVNRFHIGLMSGYGNSKSTTVSSVSGYNAKGTVEGYSAGVYGTWYDNEADKSGLYVDTWVQYSWFRNTVTGQDLASEDYKSKGVTASVESGYAFKVGENAAKNATYFIQPKAQVTKMGVKADVHTEANGTRVSGKGNDNIQTRMGVKAFMNSYSDQDKGKDQVFQPFIEINWVHNNKDFGTTMNGVSVKQDGATNIAELKLGVEGQVNKEFNLWGNVGHQVGNKGYSDTVVMLGVKYHF
ncbi:autotransporter outer membrane beta-barrel domain-containing protein [Aeromonas sp. HMWF014]|uniref:autotransporter outer membrane beta-barrel domain-containing protein n=1 Tax=Aeromonas sp. HMWF014 TaxID=2056850 RepID=UPI000D332CC2|nr:autotransporter outer membrane beta-barrel domain-containing protein [Aeromonas sp. HMWF014]PTT52445.1 type V secretion protein A [Aeromonas sp. HMWF014]